ncbi:GNAT family N-acetyltransferase [Vibrio sp. T11.5]|uniref:GNAT family N-acetyltransferase n=1 Tax=Vibrio sp. T11.5 TaxID=2998836 RepID=UPI0022CD9956|nr:GNAT family N-acetyltransferase [Vibrio sp. T11.5]MDA0119177.1 GNAT family N-acetyltransferase [Vibrio sp. T11.5]
MEVQLVKIKPEERYVLENLFCYYVYDMSEYMKWNPTKDGHFDGYDVSKFDPYWERDDHTPYFIKVNNEMAGFVLVRRYPSDPKRYDIEQFFVLRKFKGQGVGRGVLAQVVKAYPGKWQIRILQENSGALSFWKSAVSRIVGENYTLSKANDVDLVMLFIQFETPSGQAMHASFGREAL